MTPLAHLYVCPQCGSAWHKSDGRYCPECREEGELADNED